MGLFDSNKALAARCVGISNEGCGVVRIEEKGAKEEGMKVFVHDMLPGEKGRIRITERKNNMTYGVKAGQTETSKNRCKPMCPEFPRCGGCQIQHATYESQLQMKESMVRNCLVRMGHFPENEIRACMEKILPSKEQFYYRNQMQYPVEYSREKRCVNIGLYERNSHRIVEHEKCFLADPSAEIIRNVAQIFFSGLDQIEAAKALRQIVVRVGMMSKEMMIIFVVNKPVKIKADAFVKAASEALKNAKNGMRIVSLWTEERPSGTKWKNPKGVWTNIWGETTIREILGNRVFRISPDSFFQVNSKQTVVLYDKIKEYLRKDGVLPRMLLDLYCGTGSIGIYCSDACHHMYGIESVESAVIDARNNARAKRTESIKAFGTGPLGESRVFHQQFACSDIVGAGVTEDVVLGLSFGNFLTAFADDNAQLPFIDNFTGIGIWFDDGFTVGNEGSRWFQHPQRLLWNIRFFFAFLFSNLLGKRVEIVPQQNHLAGTARGHQLDVRQFDGFTGRLRIVEHITAINSNGIAF